MNNTGIHHISSLVGNIHQAYHFYHQVLGLKLVLKTVNQEDSSMYHLFFGDDLGRVGTEFTIFDMPHHARQRLGTNRLERTLFLVRDKAALNFWANRLTTYGIEHEGVQAFGQKHLLMFEDEDGQLLGLTYQETRGKMFPYEGEDIPAEMAIFGIAGIQLRVREEGPLLDLLTEVFGFEEEERLDYQGQKLIVMRFDNVFQHRIHLIVDKDSPISVTGVGGIHHLALGVLDRSDLEDLVTRLNLVNRPHSGIINRDFMHSLYFRAPNYLLFEVATMVGQRETSTPKQAKNLDQVELFLPSFFEEERETIEAGLKQK